MGLVLQYLTNRESRPYRVETVELKLHFLYVLFWMNNIKAVMKIHAGKKVKEHFAASGLSVSEFARRLNCHRQNVYDIFRREVIDVGLLQRISRVLEHDFVTELYGSPNSTKVTLKCAITVEMENGECKVTEVKAVK